MANFLDFITAKAQGLYWNEQISKTSERPFLGDELFAPRKQVGMNLDMIKGANSRPVVLNISALDAKSIKRSRIGFSTMSAKMPFFKNSMDIDEELRQKLLLVADSNVAYIQEVIRRIFDDNTKLLKDAALTREMMAMQLITTGTVAIANNGQEYFYDYGLEAEQKQTVDTAWSNPDADIVGDITKYQDAIEAKTGTRPSRLVMRRAQLRNMMKNNNIKNSIYVLGQGKVNVSELAVKNFLADNAGITAISVYEKSYVDVDGEVKYFIPEDTVVLLPEGNIGYMNFGTTPEEADLLGTKQADVTIVDTGVALTVTRETDPVRVTTKVSELCMPSGENIDKIVIIDVAA